jgi:hypothetical protein
MKTISSSWSVLALVVGVSMSWGCMGDSFSMDTSDNKDANPTHTDMAALSIVNGHVTDLGAGEAALGLAGPSTKANTKSVRISQILEGGALKTLSEASLDATGAYSAKVPMNLQALVAQALDTSGKVIGSALIAASGSVKDEIVVAAPITTESSVEAQVYLDLSGCECTCAADKIINLATVTGLIDAELSATLTVAAKAGVEVKGLIHALAKACLSAKLTELHALANADVEVNADVLAKAELKAVLALAASLDANVTLDKVTAQFLADIDAALEAAGAASAEVRAEAKIAASLSFRTSLAASLAADANAQAVLVASIQAAAQLEADATAKAVIEIVTLSGTGQAAIDAAVKAGAKLVADVNAATSVDAIKEARLDFIASISGTGSVLDLVLQANVQAQAALKIVLETTAQLSAQLDVELKAALSAFVKVDACVNADASADLDVAVEAILTAMAKFTASVNALTPKLVGATPAQAEGVASAVAIAQAMFHTP